MHLYEKLFQVQMCARQVALKLPDDLGQKGNETRRLLCPKRLLVLFQLLQLSTTPEDLQWSRHGLSEPLLAINHHTAEALPEQHFES
mmetsp:Transcript_29700/g.49064  ORF Transcript_29700/g.49064 Transcript_29700/m.49064 type:complete len:87 (-) Transcript_29700:306-566(-)